MEGKEYGQVYHMQKIFNENILLKSKKILENNIKKPKVVQKTVIQIRAEIN